MRLEYTINIGDRTIRLRINQYEEIEEVNVEKLLLIDHSNILAEIITFPIILNRFGLLLSESENKYNLAELDCKIFKAKRRKEIRRNFELNKKKFTADVVDDEYRSDPSYKAKQIRSMELKKKHSIMNSIYWSLKDKSDKLNKISEKIQPGDLDWDKLAKKFNGINITLLTQLIK